MQLFRYSICMTCFVALTGISMAQADYDISPRWSGTSGSPITTYGYDDGLVPAPEALTSDTVRVFQFDMDNPGPNTTTDPGFHALSTDSGYTASGLPDGSWLSFNVLSDLQYWNGSSFSAVPANESLVLQLGPSSVAVGTGTGTQAGFLIGKVGPPSQSSQGLHVHLSSTITGPGGIDPTDGIYMFEIDLKLLGSDQVTPYPGVNTSLPFWVIYNHDLNNLNDPVDDAVAYQTSQVPEPSSFVLAGLAAVMVFATRRRTQSNV